MRRGQSGGQSPERLRDILFPKRHHFAHIFLGVVRNCNAIVLFGNEMWYHKNYGTNSHDDGTDPYPYRYVSSATQVAHEDDSDDVANLVRGGYQSR